MVGRRQLKAWRHPHNRMRCRRISHSQPSSSPATLPGIVGRSALFLIKTMHHLSQVDRAEQWRSRPNRRLGVRRKFAALARISAFVPR